MQMVLVVLF